VEQLMYAAYGQVMEPSPTIYIVDDDAAVRAGLALLVESCGWMVCPCASAEEFLRTYSPDIPGCVVLDLQMPGISGADLQEIMAARGIDLPVIVVTAYKDHPLADRVRAAGARAVLAKPFDESDLVREIDAAVGHA
jgi:FixJ family two-component response regulator